MCIFNYIITIFQFWNEHDKKSQFWVSRACINRPEERELDVLIQAYLKIGYVKSRVVRFYSVLFYFIVETSSYSTVFCALSTAFLLYSRNANTDISGNIIKPNLWTSMNERTNTLLYKNIYLSHFILERVDISVVYEKWVQTAILTQLLLWPEHAVLSSRTHLALLPHLGRGCSTWVRWGLLSVCKLALTLAFLSPTDSTAAGICLYSFITPTCFRFFFRLFTQVHLWLTARSRVNI